MFWGVLLGVAVLGAVVRVWRGPLWPRRATVIPPSALVIAAAAALALVFHCAAMFFAPWTDAIPGARIPGDAIRAMGDASRWAYAVPAALLVLAVRNLWWPALLALAVALLGVGITMYGPFSLGTHLAWLAALIVVGTVVSAGVVGQGAPNAVV